MLPDLQIPTREVLENLYCRQAMSVRQLAEKYKVSSDTVTGWLAKYKLRPVDGYHRLPPAELTLEEETGWRSRDGVVRRTVVGNPDNHSLHFDLIDYRSLRIPKMPEAKPAPVPTEARRRYIPSGQIKATNKQLSEYHRRMKMKLDAYTLPNSIGDIRGLFEESRLQDQWFGPDHPYASWKHRRDAWNRYFRENGRAKRESGLLDL